MKTINLTQGAVALVDDEDFERVSKYRWRLQRLRGKTKLLRALRHSTEDCPHFLMHRLIMNAPPHMVVDHINGDGLDNRKENLRLCTQAENCRNSRKKRGVSKYKGVWRRSDTKKWSAEIILNRTKISLGCFVSEEEAAQSYDDAARKYFGAFALCNFAKEA